MNLIRAYRQTVVSLLAIALSWCGQTARADDAIGANLAPNAGFEEAAPTGGPADWTADPHPKDSAKVSLDSTQALAGKTALRLEVPATGGVSIRCKPVVVTGGTYYLFSVAYRSEGFGPRGKYSGVSASMSLQWLDAAGKQVSTNAEGVAFPYHATEWDLRDRIIQAPAGAAQVIIRGGISNDSQKQTGTNIPSILWLDAIQMRVYTPPPSPAWALKPPERIVEGGYNNSQVIMPPLGELNMAGGKWSRVILEKDAAWGSAVESPDGVGPGMMCHSPYYAYAKPGLYRAIVRCKVRDITRKEKAGAVDIDSETASTRACIEFFPSMFGAPNRYQEFPLDFVIRSKGWWDFRVYTGGNQPFTVESVRVFPLRLLDDFQILDIYPGSDGRIAPELTVRHQAPFSALLVAGLHYDAFAVAPALRLTGFDVKLDTVWVQKGNAQNFPGFPNDPAVLFKYDVVCLCDVDFAGFDLRQKRLLVEYVKRGGGLIVLGGHKALDRGGMRNALVQEILPVTATQLTADIPLLLEYPRGAALQAADPVPVTEKLDFAAQPVCFWLHDLQARKGAQTWLRVDGHPAIVAARFGQGRTVCVGLTCFGQAAKEQTPFWRWSGWTLLLRDSLWWAAGHDERFAQD